jgi:hypothetical protein
MRSLRWIVGGFFAAGLLAVSLISARPAEVDITGYYGEKDGEYTKISRNGDNVYQYLNHQKAGDWIGVAIREGDSLSIGWQKSDGRNLGVSVYRIEKGDKGPTLTGAWTNYPGGGTVKDSLRWSRKLDSRAI